MQSMKMEIPRRGEALSAADARCRSPASTPGEEKNNGLRGREGDEILRSSSMSKRHSACKSRPLWYVLAIIIVFGCVGSLLISPAGISGELPLSLTLRRSVDPRYISNLEVDWLSTAKIIRESGGLKNNLRVGLMNFNHGEINVWRNLLPGSEFVGIELNPVSAKIRWEDLYPEWIDEDEEFEVPKCPSLPEPAAVPGAPLDLIAVKLPCDRSGPWTRDVARLHLQLAAAKLATWAASSLEALQGPLVLFLTDCFPIPNLFKCRDLVARDGGSLWLYRPALRPLRESLNLPVGSCTLSLPLSATAEEARPRSAQREAYATILHSAPQYVCGAIVAAQSIRMSGSTRDLVILVDETISEEHRAGLASAGWQVRTIQRIRNPKAEKDAYNEWNYSKFRLWQLTDYDKVIFVDADLLVLRNIDALFGIPEITATGNNATLFNSGLMVVEPSNCTFDLLMAHVEEFESYNGGDQGYLNEIFTWWHRLPRKMNFLKHFWAGDEEERKQAKIRLFGADPPLLFVLHYLGLKPWFCFRDYDCNWNVGLLREFASDVAHQRWWRVHDAMPGHLQSFCLLRSKQKAGLEWDRRQAQKANFSDEHWRRPIADPRLNICREKFCFWESMLWHWGEPNSTR
ncbi:plant glycogenin-like starch initiation protein 2 [Wolffia australiana]